MNALQLAPLLLAITSVAVSAAEAEPHPFLALLPGNYALVGRAPDGGAAYAGTAEITLENGALVLHRKVDGKLVTATGGIERAAMAEADVLRFRWPGFEATCLMGVDLDNYARLSCLWYAPGTRRRAPGLEAWFATDAWHSTSTRSPP